MAHYSLIDLKNYGRPLSTTLGVSVDQRDISLIRKADFHDSIYHFPRVEVHLNLPKFVLCQPQAELLVALKHQQVLCRLHN